MDITVPTVGESITEVTLSRWLVEDGDYVEMDQELCELESDKATFELPAEKAGIIKRVAKEGDDLPIGAVVCTIDTEAAAPEKVAVEEEEIAIGEESKVIPEKSKDQKPIEKEPVAEEAASIYYANGYPSPAAAKIMEENGIMADAINGTGKGGRITKQDVVEYLEAGPSEASVPQPGKAFSREERREPLSRLRRTIATHLVAAKNETAMLTTFNEVDMEPVMTIRNQHKQAFEKKHGVRLGFMSFFTKAVCNALKDFPAVNARIDGKDLIYRDYCDIGMAVSTPKGLVVPVIRNAESLSLAEIEAKVYDFAVRGRDNKLGLDEIEGGTFTISNGGVFGSLLSTPILNAPQSAILGMHKIEERPIALDGQVVIRPMMYLALSYDHRVIDGKQSVSFLVRIKENLENPEYLLEGVDPVKKLLGL